MKLSEIEKYLNEGKPITSKTLNGKFGCDVIITYVEKRHIHWGTKLNPETFPHIRTLDDVDEHSRYIGSMILSNLKNDKFNKEECWLCLAAENGKFIIGYPFKMQCGIKKNHDHSDECTYDYTILTDWEIFSLPQPPKSPAKPNK